MKVDVAVRTYRGGAAQRWQRLSGNGRSPRGLAFLVMLDVGVCHTERYWRPNRPFCRRAELRQYQTNSAMSTVTACDAACAAGPTPDCDDTKRQCLSWRSGVM